MTETPYTDDDLRAEAARQIKYTLDNLDTDGLLDASTYELGHGGRWEQLAEGDWRDALRRVDELVEGAADVSEWAVNLGADGLEPSAAHEITIDAGRPIARVLFAFEPGMPEEMRTALVEGLSHALDDADAALDEPAAEDGDSDSDVFDLISDIASRLRDATDSGEHQAVGLIYELANWHKTVTQARAELADIEFRHV